MYFKKHISLFLTFFLLVSQLGLAFNVHYCEDKIASISLNAALSSKQVVDECCGVVEKESNCCNDKIIKAKSISDQIIVKSLSYNVDFISIISDWKPLLFASNFNFKQSNTVNYYCHANAPPLYLLYSQYAFYC